MRKRIVIATHSHLCRNPRVLKEAILLSEKNYQVIVLTAIHSKELLQEDQVLIKDKNIEYKFYADLRSMSLKAVYDRVIMKLFTALQTLTGIETRFTIGYGARKLKQQCIEANASLYIMHQELPTIVGSELLRKNYKIAFDFEDWYSEDLLPEARKRRPLKLLRRAEWFALNNARFCMTTSRALSDRLAKEYCCQPPHIIYNVFPSYVRRDETDFNKRPLKLFWFSQTIGPGRGLENFITILKNISQKIELHLLGAISNSFREYLSELGPSHLKIRFHGLVEEKKLPAIISSFDIGLALELTDPLSRNYTITNKYFQYLQAGLPIISSKTFGQNEVFSIFRPGFLLPQNPDAKKIAALEHWLNNPEKLKEAKKNAELTSQYYNWEIESGKLSDIVDEAISNEG